MEKVHVTECGRAEQGGGQGKTRLLVQAEINKQWSQAPMNFMKDKRTQARGNKLSLSIDFLRTDPILDGQLPICSTGCGSRTY